MLHICFLQVLPLVFSFNRHLPINNTSKYLRQVVSSIHPHYKFSTYHPNWSLHVPKLQPSHQLNYKCPAGLVEEKDIEMGGSGYTRQRRSSSSFSILNIFKCCCSQERDDISEEGRYVRSCDRDDDGSRWTAEPDIDRRASAFIDGFKRSVTESECERSVTESECERRVTESECQALAI